MKVKQKLLIVDDDPLNLAIVSEIFDETHSIVKTISGEKAIEALPQIQPDLILLDIMLPGIDGYEVTRKIRADRQYQFTKIMLISAKVSLAERLEGYRSGADDYIVKPFDHDELQARVAVLLRLKRAEEIDLLKGELMNFFSHETRTPLTGILGYAEMLANDVSLPDSARKRASGILKNGHRLLDLTKKAELHYEMISRGIMLEKIDDSVNRHLKRAVTSCEKDALRKKIRVELDLADDAIINGDWSLLDLAFGYLVDNAIKFSPENGTVTIRLEKRDGFCLVHFRDEGGGIKEELLDKIFDVFAARENPGFQIGHGLSLAMARNILRLHGGTIDAVNSSPNGAVFTIGMPFEVNLADEKTFRKSNGSPVQSDRREWR